MTDLVEVIPPSSLLTLGHVLDSVGADHDPPIRLEDIRVIRHAFQPGDHLGRQYVGKADGGERILGRWMQYARDGHGGNVALPHLAAAAGVRAGAARTDQARHFVFSILRVFGPSTSSTPNGSPPTR